MVHPIPEFLSLNPVVSKILMMNIFTDEKIKINKKRLGMAKLFKKECPMWKDFQLNVEQFRNVPLDVASANVECKSSEEDFEYLK